MGEMRSPYALRLRPGQVILFAPMALLFVLVLTAIRNGCARPVVMAADSPDGTCEAVVFLEYPPAYPFLGEVRAILEVRRLPGHKPILSQLLSSHRWSSAPFADYHAIEWTEGSRVTLRSADGARARSIFFEEEVLRRARDATGGAAERRR
jgi:hypothetical protein